jgi:hypothetical protein
MGLSQRRCQVQLLLQSGLVDDQNARRFARAIDDPDAVAHGGEVIFALGGGGLARTRRSRRRVAGLAQRARQVM